MARRLILRNDNFEAVDRAGVILLFQIVAGDFHFLAGKLVTGNFYLLLGTGGVFAARIFPDDFIKRGKGLLVRAWSRVMSGISSKYDEPIRNWAYAASAPPGCSVM